jgi:hypothetical protein
MNKRKLPLLISVLLLTAGQAFTQPSEAEKSSRTGIGFGYTFSGYRESTIIDVNRYLNAFVFAVDGSIEKGRFLHSFSAVFFRGENEALIANPVYIYELYPDMYGQLYEYYQADDTFTRLFLEYALDWMLWGNRTFPGYLGGALRGDIYLTETLVNPIYLNFTGLLSLNLHVSQKWIINAKNELALSLSLPVFGYAIRPHYIGFSAWPLETGIVSFHNYWAGFGNLKYYYKISTLLSLYSDIGFELSRIDFPKPRKDAGLRINLGIAFTY